MNNSKKLLQKVLDFHMGVPPYDFWKVVDLQDRDNQRFDAWNEIIEEIRTQLATVDDSVVGNAFYNAIHYERGLEEGREEVINKLREQFNYFVNVELL